MSITVLFIISSIVIPFSSGRQSRDHSSKIFSVARLSTLPSNQWQFQSYLHLPVPDLWLRAQRIVHPDQTSLWRHTLGSNTVPKTRFGTEQGKTHRHPAPRQVTRSTTAWPLLYRLRTPCDMRGY